MAIAEINDDAQLVELAKLHNQLSRVDKFNVPERDKNVLCEASSILARIAETLTPTTLEGCGAKLLISCSAEDAEDELEDTLPSGHVYERLRCQAVIATQQVLQI